MGDLFKVILQMILVVTASVLLCLFVPALMLIELFLVLLGTMIIIGGGLVIMREVTMQSDLRHHNKIHREILELKLRNFKRQHSLLNNPYNRIVRRRIFHHY